MVYKRLESFSSKSECVAETINLSKKHLSLSNGPRDTYIAFLITVRFFSGGKPKILQPRFKKYRKKIFRRKFLFFSLCSNRNTKCSFDNPADNFPTKKWSLVVQGTSLFPKLKDFQKEIFCFRMDHWTCRSQFWQI